MKKNWAENPNRQFSEEITMDSKCMKQCSVALAILEIQILITMELPQSYQDDFLVRKTEGRDADEHLEKEELLHIVGRNVDQCSHCENSMYI